MSAFWDRKEKPLIGLLFALPFCWMLTSLLMGRYFPDPGKLLMPLSGSWAGVYIVSVLALTPLAKIKALKVLSRYRRFVGLTAFFYSLLHLVIYLLLFAGLSWSWIRSDLIEKPYIYAGVLAILILFLLAITSTKKMMRRLGRNWKKLHRFIYLAALAVIAHLWWQVKSDISTALWFSVFLLPLLLMRWEQFPLLKHVFKKR
ncbi:sulfite oxidase heme-binding subunit YedZ [Marinomonas pollencensis]|uniref:Protein-methionine-sulfoxide reductase heme-binding subunit MsrQ n=1 Tax=Marinomonas pollencensis TaxID=491954 RepID=A0A3E0DEZ6_9GAMM|nr:ferric reductase-like transmembrane domain-containing protein [Marinomonas pollencensis]REG81280.1 sulfoxide reductase heme-binding subunit YedZ [Marinomonas pollencensis]